MNSSRDSRYHMTRIGLLVFGELVWYAMIYIQCTRVRLGCADDTTNNQRRSGYFNGCAHYLVVQPRVQQTHLLMAFGLIQSFTLCVAQWQRQPECIIIHNAQRTQRSVRRIWCWCLTSTLTNYLDEWRVGGRMMCMRDGLQYYQFCTHDRT